MQPGLKPAMALPPSCASVSTTNWPAMLAAVVFCQGCPWRCGYCYNPHLIPPRGDNEIPWDDVLAFLRRRQS